MAKVEEAVRDLIRYHAKRVASDVVGKLPDRVKSALSNIRALQKHVEELSAEVRKLTKAREREMAVPPAPEEEASKARFSKRTLKSIGKRFDLTQEELARLLEVSTVTVTLWETGKSRPRPSNLAQIITLREMSQEQVDEALGRESVPASVTPKQIKALRKKLSLTQADLAKRLGVSTSTVTAWERGKATPGRQARKALKDLMRAPAAATRQAPPSTPPASELTPAQISELRKKAGLSQAQLAARLGVSPNTVSNWETGNTTPRRSSVEKLRALAESS